jgi:hypothetical protein
MTLIAQMGRCNSVTPVGPFVNKLTAVPQLQRPLCVYLRIQRPQLSSVGMP